jgi:hypothetical protein
MVETTYFSPKIAVFCLSSSKFCAEPTLTKQTTYTMRNAQILAIEVPARANEMKKRQMWSDSYTQAFISTVPRHHLTLSSWARSQGSPTCLRVHQWQKNLQKCILHLRLSGVMSRIEQLLAPMEQFHYLFWSVVFPYHETILFKNNLSTPGMSYRIPSNSQWYSF